MKLLVVGMNPSNKPTKQKPSATFKKLESWMDQLGVRYFSFINTFDEMGQAKLAKADLTRLCTVAKDYDKIIALGGFVSTALNKCDVTHFKMPHPSPRNRLLNDKSFETYMIKQCRRYLK